MKFSELLNLLKKALPIPKNNQPEFMSNLLNLFIEDSAEDDPRFEQFSDFTNKSTITKIFNGQRKFPKDIADFILSNSDKSKFVDLVSKLSYDTSIEIINVLTDKGLYCPKNVDLSDTLADIFIKFLHAASAKKDELDLKDIDVSKEAALRNNKRPVPLELSEYSPDDNVINIGNEHIKLPPGLKKPKDIQQKSEAPYIKALLEVYSENKNKVFSLANLNELPQKCKHHLERQRAEFYSSESIARIARETFSDGEAQFKRLEKEAYDGIEPTYHSSCPNGKERLRIVQDKITSTTLSASKLANIVGLINNEAKKGLCHKLVNDNYIKSWVNIDDEDF